jgi:hypothetical protein
MTQLDCELDELIWLPLVTAGDQCETQTVCYNTFFEMYAPWVTSSEDCTCGSVSDGEWDVPLHQWVEGEFFFPFLECEGLVFLFK